MKVLFLSLLAMFYITGCSKNSYQSCVEYQTESAKRTYKGWSSTSLQEYTDMLVSSNCKVGR